MRVSGPVPILLLANVAVHHGESESLRVVLIARGLLPLRDSDWVDIINFALPRKRFVPPFRYERVRTVQLRSFSFRW